MRLLQWIIALAVAPFLVLGLLYLARDLGIRGMVLILVLLVALVAFRDSGGPKK